MRPTHHAGRPRKSACCSKARRGCPATLPTSKKPGLRALRNQKKSRRDQPGGFWRGDRREGNAIARPLSFASAGAIGAALPMMTRATVVPTHADQHGEAALLAIVEAL